MLEFVFWVIVFLLVWTWILYPLLIMAAAGLLGQGGKPRPGVERFASAPSISILIAAHNEERVIRQRIENCLTQDYDPSKLEVIIASDHSTDSTNDIVASYVGDPRVRLVRSVGRGKSSAQNEAFSSANGDIVLFSDADATFAPGCIRKLAARFADPVVGCVAGHVIWRWEGDSAVTVAGNLYWKYEFSVWQLESRLGMLAWCGGMCMAIRKNLFRPIEPYHGEDSVVPLDIVTQGFKVVYERGAIVEDSNTANVAAAQQMRTRMTLRSFAGTWSRRHLLNPFQFPKIALSLWSHKLLRWLTPYLLIGWLVSSVPLMRHPLFASALGIQVLFYLAAFSGYLLEKYQVRIPILSSIYAFCRMNLGFGIGVAKAILGRRIIAYPSLG